MPHSVDMTGLTERLFVLHNLCHASRSLCDKYKIGRYVDDVIEYEWNDYFGWLKVIVCESLIHLATRIRIIEDSVRSDEQEIEFEKIDKESRKGLMLGKLQKGNEKVTIRELCNKIIHAKSIAFDWAPFTQSDDKSPEYWTGTAWLLDEKGKAEWKLELSVEDLCVAFRRYIEILEYEVDWDSLYKYDE